MSRQRRRHQLVRLALLTVWSVFALAGVARAAQTTIAPVRLSIVAPATITAGTETAVTVAVDGFSRGVTVTLVVDGSFGPRFYTAPVTEGEANFAISSDDLSRTGVTTIVASLGSSRARATVEILPGAPVEPVEPWVGSRSIIADGTSWSMAVAAPMDALGNPVAEGTGVTVNARRPTGDRETWDVGVSHLLAWTRIVSGQLAGRTTIGMSAGDATGPDAVLDEVPGWPVAIVLSTRETSPPADGTTLVTVRSEIMRDPFGNVVADGTAVSFVVRDPTGTERRLTGYTIGGVVEIPLQAPVEPGTVEVSASVGEAVSPPLAIPFSPGPAIGSFPVTAVVDADTGTVTLTAGPILSELNAFVPTGTVVTFSVTGPSGETQSLTATTQGGYASTTLRLADLAAGTHAVSATAGSGSGTTEFAPPAPQ